MRHWETFFEDVSGPCLIYQTKDKESFKSRDAFLQALDVTVLLEQKSSQSSGITFHSPNQIHLCEDLSQLNLLHGLSKQSKRNSGQKQWKEKLTLLLQAYAKYFVTSELKFKNQFNSKIIYTTLKNKIYHTGKDILLFFYTNKIQIMSPDCVFSYI